MDLFKHCGNNTKNTKNEFSCTVLEMLKILLKFINNIKKYIKLFVTECLAM